MEKIQIEGDNSPTLTVWKIHPDGFKIVKADNKLLGNANKDGNRLCGPYNFVNSMGWWVFPTVDIEIELKHLDINAHENESGFDYTIHKTYDQSDIPSMQAFQKNYDECRYNYSPRNVFAFNSPQPGGVTIWSGCFFEMPPGWSLHARAPINFPLKRPYFITEGILESSWMRYDSWFNLQFIRPNERTRICYRANEPLAQLIPVKMESYNDKWQTREVIMDENNPECRDKYDEWMDYNWEKWQRTDKKEELTFWRQRKKHFSKCPYASLFANQEISKVDGNESQKKADSE